MTSAQTGRARVVDLLTWPVLGRFLRWRHARMAMQVPVLLIAAWMIFDGLVGPQLAPKNLATVGVWLHYRGLVVLALLLAGNLFCMACPFMLTRRLGRWVREHLRVLSEAGIDLMLSGHTHRYAELPADEKRSYPIVVGGTNTLIRVDVSPERLEMTTFNDDGKVLSRPPEVPRKR